MLIAEEVASLEPRYRYSESLMPIAHRRRHKVPRRTAKPLKLGSKVGFGRLLADGHCQWRCQCQWIDTRHYHSRLPHGETAARDSGNGFRLLDPHETKIGRGDRDRDTKQSEDKIVRVKDKSDDKDKGRYKRRRNAWR